MSKGREAGQREATQPAQSGVQSLRDSMSRSLRREHDRPPADPPPPDSKRSRAQLATELDQLRWTNQKQSRVISAMERMIDQLQVARRRERRLTEREQKAVFEDQDRFLAELLEEHEAELRSERSDREAALQRVAALEAEIDAAYTYCRELERGGRPASAPGRTADAELAGSRRELAFARQRIEKLTVKCNVTRDRLQRVIRQRDEAQQTVTRLLEKTRDGVDKPPTAPPTLRPRPSSPPRPITGPRSPLAVALSNTDPARRQGSSRPAPEPGDGEAQ